MTDTRPLVLLVLAVALGLAGTVALAYGLWVERAGSLPRRLRWLLWPVLALSTPGL